MCERMIATWAEKSWMPRTGCSWRTVGSIDSAQGQQGWGGLGLHALLGFRKVKKARRPLEEWRGDPCQRQEQWRRGKQGGVGALSCSAGMWAQQRKRVCLNGLPSSSMELMPPAEAAEETGESHFWGQDRASVGHLGQGVEGPGTARQRLVSR